MSHTPVLMALILLCGCPGRDSEDTDCPTLDTTVELGTGTDRFIPLNDGDPLTFERGPQGGYHVYGSLQATGVDMGDPNYPFELTNPHIWFNVEQDGVEIALLVDQPRALTPLDDAGHVGVLGELVIFNVADPPALDGTTARFTGRLTDRCARGGDDGRDVVLTLTAL
ncbi:MAG: hypothetical protein RIT28_5163 [Pseudomonadota bacterium]